MIVITQVSLIETGVQKDQIGTMVNSLIIKKMANNLVLPCTEIMPNTMRNMSLLHGMIPSVKII